MRPQDVGRGGVAVGDLQADAVALVEAVGVGLDADLELVDLPGLERSRTVTEASFINGVKWRISTCYSFE